MALDLLEDALNGAYDVDKDGNLALVGAEFTLHQLLDFWSGYDATQEEQIDEMTSIYPHPVLHPNDVIAALIAEVRELRCQLGVLQ
jgi:hypothetical protein